jgi:hypothetical protein
VSRGHPGVVHWYHSKEIVVPASYVFFQFCLRLKLTNARRRVFSGCWGSKKPEGKPKIYPSAILRILRKTPLSHWKSAFKCSSGLSFGRVDTIVVKLRFAEFF